MLVMSTLNISVAVAVPMSTDVLGPVASAVTFSGTLSTGLVESIIFTFCPLEILLLFESVAVHVTSVSPKGNSFGASLVTITGNISMAVAGLRVRGVFSAVASATTSPCTVSTGFVVSLTVMV